MGISTEYRVRSPGIIILVLVHIDRLILPNIIAGVIQLGPTWNLAQKEGQPLSQCQGWLIPKVKGVLVFVPLTPE